MGQFQFQEFRVTLDRETQERLKERRESPPNEVTSVSPEETRCLYRPCGTSLGNATDTGHWPPDLTFVGARTETVEESSINL